MTIRDLRAKAKALGISRWSRMTREELEFWVEHVGRMRTETEKVMRARAERREA